MLQTGFLVEAGSLEGAGILPALRPGGELGGFTVVELVRGLRDTELYAARGAAGEWAALKVARPSAAAAVGDLFAREAAVLRHLDGDGAPRLLAAGELDTLAGGRPWLAIEWIAGVDAETAARELRAAARADLLDLLRRIADVYVRLHARGVLHGDVHPHNLLVERSGAVRLLDFGYARWDGGPAALLPPRAGVVFYHEPEQAAALRSGTPLPAATPAGEQYAVAALLYQLAAGAHRRDYSLEKDEMLRQVAEEPPLPFSARGIEPWPRLEAVLARALGRAPEERFPSLADFAAALAAAAPETGLAAAWGRPAGEAELDAVLARAPERVGEGGAAFTAGLPPPTASVNYGAAGVACALHRMAQAREDAPLLALADLWAERAAAAAGAPGAWHSAEIGVTRETVGESSAYHSAAGVHAVRAAIAHALGLPGLQEPAVGAFLAAAAVPGPEVDLTLGRSGLLLAGALLAGTLAPEASRRRELLAWGEALQRVLWAELDALPPLAGDSHSLGIAHGWAGYLYAALRWSRAAGTPLPAGAAGRLAELAAEAVPAGRGRRWAWRGAGQGLSMPGWCNGSAGLVFLWTLAAESLGGLSGGPDYAALAAG